MYIDRQTFVPLPINTWRRTLRMRNVFSILTTSQQYSHRFTDPTTLLPYTPSTICDSCVEGVAA